MRTHPHAEATYWVVAQSGGTFGLGWADRPVRRRCRTRDQLRNSGGNSFSAPQAEQVVLSKGTRSFGPIPHAITKPQLANVVSVAGPAKQWSGGLRHLGVTGLRRGMRSLQADGWHIDLLRSCKLIFPNDALVPVGLAFNAVLEHVPCLGEQANDFEEPSFCCVFLIPIRRKLHCLANRKFMGGHSYLSA